MTIAICYPVLQKDSLAVAAFDNKDSALYLTGADAALYKFRKGILTVIKKGPLDPDTGQRQPNCILPAGNTNSGDESQWLIPCR